MDAVIEAFKRDVDRMLLRENIKLTPGQRIRAAGRPRDLVATADLEAQLGERGPGGRSAAQSGGPWGPVS